MKKHQIEEKALMRGVFVRDNESTLIFYNRFIKLVKSLSEKSLGYKHDIENISHDIMFGIYNSAALYDCKKSRLSTWVSVVTKRKLIDIHRKRKPPCVAYELDILPNKELDIWKRLHDKESIDRFLKMIETLPIVQKDIFIQIYIRGLSISDISNHSAISKLTIRSRHARGLKCLRKNFIF